MNSGKEEENLRKVSLDDRKNSLRTFVKKVRSAKHSSSE